MTQKSAREMHNKHDEPDGEHNANSCFGKVTEASDLMSCNRSKTSLMLLQPSKHTEASKLFLRRITQVFSQVFSKSFYQCQVNSRLVTILTS